MSEPQIRPDTTRGGPFAHRPDASGICVVCKRLVADLAGTGCPPEGYKDDGRRLSDAETFERAARELWRKRS